MLNAIQNWMVDEALLEKEMHEAREKMRAKLDAMFHPQAGVRGSEATARAAAGAPVLGDLPVGKPPPGHPGYEKWLREHPDGESFPKPTTASGEHTPAPSPGETFKMPVTASGVSADVLAAGAIDRDPNRPVAKFIPETQPVDPNDPFPQLGLKGKPLA